MILTVNAKRCEYGCSIKFFSILIAIAFPCEVFILIAMLLCFSGDVLYDMKVKLNAFGNQLPDWNQNQVSPCTWNNVICDGSKVIQV